MNKYEEKILNISIRKELVRIIHIFNSSLSGQKAILLEDVAKIYTLVQLTFNMNHPDFIIYVKSKI